MPIGRVISGSGILVLKITLKVETKRLEYLKTTSKPIFITTVIARIIFCLFRDVAAINLAHN